MAKTSHTTRIAIVIPCYNYADYLSEALESVLAQLPRVGVRIECVVIDDGSTDDSRKEAEKFKSRGVRYHYRKNGGLSAARNTGLEQTKSDYVCFLDADDKLEPTFVNTCLDALKKNDYYLEYARTQLGLYPGVREGLAWAKSLGIPCGVVSNAKSRNRFRKTNSTPSEYPKSRCTGWRLR
jgi:glycosyltransferase involved in cell wall biosynthesis